MNRSVRYTIAAVFLILLSASASLGASVFIAPRGNGAFDILGSDMQGVGGIDLVVSYGAPLSNPSVNPGVLVSGAMFLPNPGFAANKIKIGIISANGLSGSSGSIATITFANWQPGAKTPAVFASFIDSKGAALSGTVSEPQAEAPANDSSNSDNAGNSNNSGNAGTSTPGFGFVPGTITLPGNQPQAEARPEVRPPEPPPAPEPAPAPAPHEAARPAEPSSEKGAEPAEAKEKQTIYSSVLDRFRTYQGERSPARMAALLDRDNPSLIRQEPKYAVSDGKSGVKILVDAQKTGTAPNFAFSGATMISLKRDDEKGEWILEALPQANTLTATIVILTDRSLIEFPLTLVPPVAGISPSEADFAAFLKDNGAKKPKYDLNGDGKHDYQDDFIYACYVQIKKEAASRRPK